MNALARRSGSLVSYLILAWSLSAQGQSLTKDPVSGNYTLTYTSLDGVGYSVLLPSNDRIDPLIEPHSVQGSGMKTFGYRVINRSTTGSVTPIASVSIRCPEGFPQLSVGSMSTSSAATLRQSLDDGLICEFLLGDDSVAMVHPGSQRSNLVIRGEGLPGVLEAKAFGFADRVTLPSELDETPDTAYHLRRKAQGIGFARGGGKATHTIGPVRLYSSAPDIVAALALVSADIGTVCGSLGWITLDTACSRLQTFLTGNPVDVRGFLDYLDAHHPDGKAIESNNAYFLLKTIAEYGRSRVNGTNLQVHYICGNRFKVRNYNAVGLPVRYEVVIPGEFGDVTAAARSAGQPFAETEFTVTMPNRTRLYYDGMAVHYPGWEFQGCT